MKKELDAKEQKILQLTREDGKGAEKWQEYTDMNKISAKLFTEI